MIYITQLIFVKKGKENVFHEFELLAIPILKKYNGKLIYRIRPTADSFIEETKELPYEIHFISFDSEADFKAFMKDKTRLEFMHLKEQSVKFTILIKGEQL